jgi:hypothetical protein
MAHTTRVSEPRSSHWKIGRPPRTALVNVPNDIARRGTGNYDLCQRCAEHETAVRDPAPVPHPRRHQEITNRQNLLESTPSRRVVAKPIRTARIGTKKEARLTRRAS